MKAIRKFDGQIIEVEKAVIGYCEVNVANINGFPMQNFYSEKDLDFNLPEEKESAVIEGWVCRDKDVSHGCDLNLFTKVKPERRELMADWIGGLSRIVLDSSLFPSLTWESEPMRCKITITPMK